MKILSHSRVIAAISSIKDLPRQINSKTISQNLRSPLIQSLQHLRGPKKDAYSGFRVSQMSMNGADAQRKNPFGDKKIVSAFWQKSNNVSDQKRDALIEKANDFLRRLDHVESVADRSVNATLRKLNNHSRGVRTEQQCEAEEIYDIIAKNIKSTRWKIQRLLQTGNLLHQHNASSSKIGLSKIQYDEIIKDFDGIKRDFQSGLKLAKNRLDDLTQL
ncbi:MULTISPECIES: hypothetical protein [Burkholderiaceae]|nr:MULTISPECIES: hypothetical protein [Burkholderiaceae]MCG1019134.1 hypothetical protein [Mycetohabitans sp. B4]SIT73252.1 hypothetical protein SAMN04487768_2741 [Burkholderia sp. b13]